MRRWKYLGRVWMVAAFGFMYVPIAVLIAFSFNESKSRNCVGRLFAALV